MNLQILINIIVSSLIYLIIAQSFSIIYYSSKFFNLTHSISITLSAYFAYLFSIQLTFSLLCSIFLSVCLSLVLALSLEKFIFRYLRRQSNHSFVSLIASLGLYIIFVNIISIIWGDGTKSIRINEARIGHKLLNAFVTDIQIVSIVLCVFLFITTQIIIYKTKLGLKIRAISSNPELANILGINSTTLVLISSMLASVLASIIGILVAFDTDMIPNMGFNLLLYGIVAMIIGGVGNPLGLVGGAFLLGTFQQLGAYYIDGKWMDVIAYSMLIIFIIWKPLGLSGLRLKKIEI
jgi:branched-chain amino acid transport system permease protein